MAFIKGVTTGYQVEDMETTLWALQDERFISFVPLDPTVDIEPGTKVRSVAEPVMTGHIVTVGEAIQSVYAETVEAWDEHILFHPEESTKTFLEKFVLPSYERVQRIVQYPLLPQELVYVKWLDTTTVYEMPITSLSTEKWDENGLYILNNGDELTVYNRQNRSRVAWEGEVKLARQGATSKSAHTLQSRQHGIPDEIWKGFFLPPSPARLVQKIK